MNGWTYLGIEIKSRYLVEKLKDLYIWSQIEDDEYVEITDDTFTYRNDDDSLLCDAPSSINEFSSALMHFLVERYDDFTSAEIICKDENLIKKVEAIDWVYSPAEDGDDDDRPEFHWKNPKVSAH